jgi:serine/threonine-protein kinase
MTTGREGTTLGIWQLERLLGSGGAGDVYLARRTDNVVRQAGAVKILRSPRPGQWSREAAAIRRLDHPQIAGFLDEGITPDGFPYLVVEYVDGPPITDYADQRALSIPERLRLFLEVCRAVEYAHEHGLLHMDLKPGNILVNGDGSVKVIDFGLAQSTDSGAAAPVVAFSAPYACPEQVEGVAELSYAADTYALGAVLYELLCGHPPFDSRFAAAELYRQILQETPDRPSQAVLRARLTVSEGRAHRREPQQNAAMRGLDVPQLRKALTGNLDRVCLHALRKEAGRRFQTVDKLRLDVARVRDGKAPSTARSHDPLYAALRRLRQWPLVVFSAAAVISLAYIGPQNIRSAEQAAAANVEVRRSLDQVSADTLAGLRAVRGRLRADGAGADSARKLDALIARLAAEHEAPSREPALRFGDRSLHRLKEILSGQ